MIKRVSVASETPLDSDDDFCSGCRNITQCHHKGSFSHYTHSGLHSPGQSYFADLWWQHLAQQCWATEKILRVRIKRKHSACLKMVRRKKKFTIDLGYELTWLKRQSEVVEEISYETRWRFNSDRTSSVSVYILVILCHNILKKKYSVMPKDSEITFFYQTKTVLTSNFIWNFNQ